MKQNVYTYSWMSRWFDRFDFASVKRNIISRLGELNNPDQNLNKSGTSKTIENLWGHRYWGA